MGSRTGVPSSFVFLFLLVLLGVCFLFFFFFFLLCRPRLYQIDTTLRSRHGRTDLDALQKMNPAPVLRRSSCTGRFLVCHAQAQFSWMENSGGESDRPESVSPSKTSAFNARPIFDRAKPLLSASKAQHTRSPDPENSSKELARNPVSRNCTWALSCPGNPSGRKGGRTARWYEIERGVGTHPRFPKRRCFHRCNSGSAPAAVA